MERRGLFHIVARSCLGILCVGWGLVHFDRLALAADRYAVAVNVADRKSSLKSWDMGGGPPDPVFCMVLNGKTTTCHLSQGFMRPALVEPDKKSGQKVANACQDSGVCVFRDVPISGREFAVLDKDLREHDLIEYGPVIRDGRCSVGRDGLPWCEEGVTGLQATIWFIPESLARTMSEWEWMELVRHRLPEFSASVARLDYEGQVLRLKKNIHRAFQAVPGNEDMPFACIDDDRVFGVAVEGLVKARYGAKYVDMLLMDGLFSPDLFKYAKLSKVMTAVKVVSEIKDANKFLDDVVTFARGGDPSLSKVGEVFHKYMRGSVLSRVNEICMLDRRLR